MTAHMSGGGGARWRGPRRPPLAVPVADVDTLVHQVRGVAAAAGVPGRGVRVGVLAVSLRVLEDGSVHDVVADGIPRIRAIPRHGDGEGVVGEEGNSDARRLGKIRENDERRERTSSRVRERRRGDSRANPTDVRPRRELCGSGPTSTRRSTHSANWRRTSSGTRFGPEGRTLFRSCEPNLGTHISFKKPNLLFLFGFLRHPNARRCCGAGQKRRHVAADLARLTRRHVRHRRRSPVGRRHRLRPPRARGASPSTRTRVFPRVPSTPRARRPREERLILSGPRVPIPGTLSPDPRVPSAPADRRPPRRPPRRRRRAQ